jgi:hypothetical protein
MANFVQIPNLPAAITLNGAEQLEAVQAGVSVRVTSSQLAALAAGVIGGNVFQIGLFTNAGNVNVPDNFHVVETIGFSQSGIGAAQYSEAGSLPPFNGGFQTADGRFWRIITEGDLLITQFGAIPDSDRITYLGTDNSPMINAAVNYANSLSGGGTVMVPATGVFACLADPNAGTIPGAIYLKSNVTLLSLGGWIVRRTLIDPMAGAFHLIRIDDSDKVTVTACNIDGNRAGNAGVNNGHTIRTHNSSNVALIGNWLYNSTGYTISSDVDINNIDISFNHIINSNADGIDFHNTGLENTTALVEGNIIDGFGFAGVPKAGIHGRGQGLKIVNNIIENCGPIINGIAGIAMGNGENVDGQQCIGNYVAMGTNCTSAKGIVTNNPNAVVIGNVVAGDTGTLSGITINGAGSTLTGNIVTVAAGVTVGVVNIGFNFGTTADRTLVSGNTAYGCGGDGFNDQGTNNKYSNNTATNCGGFAFDMGPSTGALLDSLNTQLNCISGLLNRGTGTLLDQATDISSTPTFAKVILPNAPTLGTDGANKSYVDGVFGTLFVAGQSGAATSTQTGATSTEVVLATKTIPGGLMGLNGLLNIYGSGRNNSGAASKIFRVRLGGLTGTVFLSLTNTTNLTTHFVCQIINANSASAQKGQVTNSGSFGPSNSTPAVGVVNTAIDQDVVLTAQVTGGSVADTMFFDWYSIQFSRGPT